MPSIKFELPEDLMRGLNDVSRDFDNILEDTLHAGAEVVEKKMRSNLTNVIGKNLKSKEKRDSGTLLGALGISPCRQNDNGNYDINVGFNEPRRENDSAKLEATRRNVNPLRAHASYDYFSRRSKKKAGLGGIRNYTFYKTTNAMIANILEYGKKGQAPKPFMKPAERATRKAATEAAQSKFVEVVEGKLKNGG